MFAQSQAYGIIQRVSEEDIRFESHRVRKGTFDINGKLVLVTGASSGIGFAVAKAFAEKGARLVLVARNKDRLGRALALIQSLSPRSFSIVADITGDTAATAIVDAIQNEAGASVDVLVNSAGRGILGRVEDVPVEAYRQAFDLNFIAPTALIQAVLLGMKSRQEGQIINITSGVALRGMPGVSPYCSSKAAFLRLSESLRVELIRHEIDVIDVSPGLVASNFEKNMTVYGTLRETFTTGKTTSANVVAARVIRASQRRERYVSLSWRARLVSMLDLLIPSLIDTLLNRRS